MDKRIRGNLNRAIKRVTSGKLEDISLYPSLIKPVERGRKKEREKEKKREKESCRERISTFSLHFLMIGPMVLGGAREKVYRRS